MKKIYSLLLLSTMLLLGVGSLHADEYVHLEYATDTWYDNYFNYYEDGIGTAEVYLEGSKTYYFGISKVGQSNWYANATFTSADHANKTLTQTSGNACSLTTTDAGTYVFTLRWNSSTPVLTVTYPMQATYTVSFIQGDKTWEKVYAYSFTANPKVESLGVWKGTEATGTSVFTASYTSKDIAQKLIWHNGSGEESGHFNFIDGMTYTYKSDNYQYKSYSRNLEVGNYGTICLPYAGSIVGAKLYTILGKNGSTLYLSEVVSGTLTAGTPYIIKATESEQKVTLNTNLSTAWPSSFPKANGLMGKYCKFPFEGLGDTKLENVYIVTNTEIHKASSASGIVAFRAYIDLNLVSDYNPNGDAPGRPIIAMPLESNNATDINSIEASEKAVKFFENGQLFIQKNGVVYDMTGRVVR